MNELNNLSVQLKYMQSNDRIRVRLFPMCFVKAHLIA
jgi:hypothetical protein